MNKSNQSQPPSQESRVVGRWMFRALIFVLDGVIEAALAEYFDRGLKPEIRVERSPSSGGAASTWRVSAKTASGWALIGLIEAFDVAAKSELAVTATAFLAAEYRDALERLARMIAVRLDASPLPDVTTEPSAPAELVATSPQQPQYPTDPNDPRLLAAGLSPEDRALVAATNRGETVAQYVRARQGESDELERLRLNKRLHELRKRHPNLVRPAQRRKL